MQKGDIVIRNLSARAKIGCWTQKSVHHEEGLMVIKNEKIDMQQASMAVLNPLTAWGLLDSKWHKKTLEKGDWVIQNAANSAVGRCVIQIAKHLGFKTFNVVRRKELIDELKKLGADEVVLDNDEYIAKAKELNR
eukprot:UN07905